MCNQIFNCTSCWNIISLIIGAILSGIVTIILIRLFRPKLCFKLPVIGILKGEKIIKVTVRNTSKCFVAVNLRIEMAVVLENETFHFDLDRQDFLMLSKNKNIPNGPQERTYHAFKVADYTTLIAPNCVSIEDLLRLLENDSAFLRVRVHSYHEFTGFGKAFEATFKYKNETFIAMNNKNVCLK